MELQRHYYTLYLAGKSITVLLFLNLKPVLTSTYLLISVNALNSELVGHGSFLACKKLVEIKVVNNKD
jgi:hypothetical protein